MVYSSLLLYTVIRSVNCLMRWLEITKKEYSSHLKVSRKNSNHFHNVTEDETHLSHDMVTIAHSG